MMYGTKLRLALIGVKETPFRIRERSAIGDCRYRVGRLARPALAQKSALRRNLNRGARVKALSSISRVLSRSPSVARLRRAERVRARADTVALGSGLFVGVVVLRFSHPLAHD